MILNKKNNSLNAKIKLGGSKSISNRLLILNALYDQKITLKNISDSEDTLLLKNALENNNELIDIHHAGTAMRFLTSFYVFQNQTKILTGSKRMKQRPLGILVDALNSLGAKIEFLENKGFPPIKINPSEFNNNKIQIQANTSSQFITSLLLIGGKLPKGLEIELIGKITSLPYLEMTIKMLNDLGIKAERQNNILKVFYTEVIKKQNFTIESDWSSASYHFSYAAIAKKINLEISYLFKESLQGDSKVVEIYEKYFGVKTNFKDEKIILSKIEDFKYPKKIELDLNDCPDIAQTIAVTCSALKIPTLLTGLETLKIKESDRILALHNELKKCGVKTIPTNSTLEIINFEEISIIPKIETYNDHRIAMAFAPLSLIYPIEIQDEMVVEKSYPNFWKDLDSVTK